MVTLSDREKRTEGFEEDALREVLAIERQAQGILRDAEAEAKRIVAAAEQQAQEMQAEAEAHSRELAEASLRDSLRELESQTHTIQEQAEQDAERWVQAAQGNLARAVAYVVDVVTLHEAH